VAQDSEGLVASDEMKALVGSSARRVHTQRHGGAAEAEPVAVTNWVTLRD